MNINDIVLPPQEVVKVDEELFTPEFFEKVEEVETILPILPILPIIPIIPQPIIEESDYSLNTIDASFQCIRFFEFKKEWTDNKFSKDFCTTSDLEYYLLTLKIARKKREIVSEHYNIPLEYKVFKLPNNAIIEDEMIVLDGYYLNEFDDEYLLSIQKEKSKTYRTLNGSDIVLDKRKNTHHNNIQKRYYNTNKCFECPFKSICDNKK